MPMLRRHPRQLQDGRNLTGTQPSQQYDLAAGELKRIVMRAGGEMTNSGDGPETGKRRARRDRLRGWGGETRTRKCQFGLSI